MNRRTFILASLATACQAAGAQVRHTVPGGVNVAGLEFNPERLPGRIDTDYVAPRAAEIAYYRAAGAKLIRIPFLWERLQPTLGDPFDEDYAAIIDSAVTASAGMRIVLDAHQFGRRRIDRTQVIIGESPAAPSSDFAAFWAQLATRYHANRNVIFNLQNEPHDQDMSVLVATQNEAIAAIRATGAAQLILVSGNAWSGAHSWNDSGNAVAMLRIRDPANNIAFDVHQYLDPNSSGTGPSCAHDASQRLGVFTAWARAHGKRGFLGEFGAAGDAACSEQLGALLDDVQSNADVWIGWTYWAGGAWWPDSYPLSIKPASIDHPVDRPQMRVLRRYFS